MTASDEAPESTPVSRPSAAAMDWVDYVRGRNRPGGGSGAVLLLVCLAAVGCWRMHQTPAPVPPPKTSTVKDWSEAVSVEFVAQDGSKLVVWLNNMDELEKLIAKGIVPDPHVYTQTLEQ